MTRLPAVTARQLIAAVENSDSRLIGRREVMPFPFARPSTAL